MWKLIRGNNSPENPQCSEWRGCVCCCGAVLSSVWTAPSQKLPLREGSSGSLAMDYQTVCYPQQFHWYSSQKSIFHIGTYQNPNPSGFNSSALSTMDVHIHCIQFYVSSLALYSHWLNFFKAFRPCSGISCKRCLIRTWKFFFSKEIKWKSSETCKWDCSFWKSLLCH